MLWTASSPPIPRGTVNEHWQLYNYIVSQYGNLYFIRSPYNIVEKYSTNFQLQWTKNYLSNDNYLRSENPYDESVLIYESQENPPLACYNADGSFRWRKNYRIPSYWQTVYGPENDIYTITGSTVPTTYTFLRINSQTGELVCSDTANVGPNATHPNNRMRVDQNRVITFAGADRVVQLIYGIDITYPQEGTLMIAGEVDTIKWKGGEDGQYLSLQYSVDGGRTYDWVNLEQVEASEGKCGWDIPDDIIGRRAIIKILDASNGDSLAASDTFKIKPYIITRVDENGEYIAYDKSTDRWGFSNNPDDMWPQSWWQRFDYWGIDPFTNKNYSVW